MTSSAEITNEIETLSTNLAKVSSTVDIVGKPAIIKAEQIAKELDSARERLASALADEVLAAREARLSQFTSIRVDYPKDEASLISIPFTIRYQQNSWDAAYRMSMPQDHTCSGFSQLPDEAFEYLVTVHPEAIPAPIMALSPNDPHEAFRIYLAAKARGYFRGRAA